MASSPQSLITFKQHCNNFFSCITNYEEIHHIMIFGCAVSKASGLVEQKTIVGASVGHCLLENKSTLIKTFIESNKRKREEL